jgi:20S proteasome subunit beta 2
VTAVTRLKRRLFQYQGHIGAALVLGGVDSTGAHLYTVYPHGSTDKLPFVSMGSGSLAAMSVLESGFKDDLSEEECVVLVRDAIRAGIFNDLGSGSNVDVCILRADGSAEMRRNYEKLNEVEPERAKYTRPDAIRVPAGATHVLKEIFTKRIVVEDVSVPAAAGGGAAGDS